MKIGLHTGHNLSEIEGFLLYFLDFSRLWCLLCRGGSIVSFVIALLSTTTGCSIMVRLRSSASGTEVFEVVSYFSVYSRNASEFLFDGRRCSPRWDVTAAELV